MDSKQAIDILKRGAGIAESEDGLIDAQRTGSVLLEIAALIERQERVIEFAIDQLNSACPPIPCPTPHVNNQRVCGECWREWLEKECGE